MSEVKIVGNMQIFSALFVKSAVDLKDLPEERFVKEIIESLGIPLQDVAIIMINGRGTKSDAVLKSDDVLALFPPVGGG